MKCPIDTTTLQLFDDRASRSITARSAEVFGSTAASSTSSFNAPTTTPITTIARMVMTPSRNQTDTPTKRSVG